MDKLILYDLKSKYELEQVEIRAKIAVINDIIAMAEAKDEMSDAPMNTAVDPTPQNELNF